MGIARGDIVAFVGAGGKSGAILQVAGELGEAGVPVLVTPTTKMFVSEADKVGPVVTSEDGDGLRSKVTEALTEQGAVVAGSRILSKKRVGGVDPAWVPQLARLTCDPRGADFPPPSTQHPLPNLFYSRIPLVVSWGQTGLATFSRKGPPPEVFSELTGMDGHYPRGLRPFPSGRATQ